MEVVEEGRGGINPGWGAVRGSVLVDRGVGVLDPLATPPGGGEGSLFDGKLAPISTSFTLNDPACRRDVRNRPSDTEGRFIEGAPTTVGVVIDRLIKSGGCAERVRKSVGACRGREVLEVDGADDDEGSGCSAIGGICIRPDDACEA